MLWLLVGVTSAALAAIVGYRIHLVLADRAAMHPDPVVVATPASAQEAQEAPPAVNGTAARTVNADEPPPSAPRTGPSGARTARC